ncbi:MAG: NACHT domain-containing protein, partial [Anaerolineales bacterium]|nr:NACHT domain-containing protein [Anaerolineales bacterium]
RNGRIPDILFYVQTHNPFMFQKYAERLAPFYELPHERSEEEKLATYLTWVERQYGGLHLLDMGRKRPLQDVYTAVELLDKPEAYRHLNIKTLQQNTMAKKRVDGLLLVKSEKRLFVQGGPGAGKTTFLKHLALESARQDGQLPFVPVFVDLQMLADTDKDLFRFVVDEFAIGGFSAAAPFVQRCIRDGRLLLLLDGLDELPVEDGQRKRVEQKIEQLVRQQQNQNCHIVLTCRTAAEHRRFEQFDHVQVAAFDAAQVNKFVSGWFHDDESKKRAMLAALAAAENKGVKDLTQTPLLLALLCMAAEDSATTVLFERRADVYQKAFDVLLRRWDAGRGIKRDAFYRNMTAERKQQMLAFIAYETFSKSEKLIPLHRLQELLREYLVTLPDASPAQDIPTIAVLRAMIAQHGIFVERSRGIYAFAHLSFQEYFTAKYIVANVQHGTLERLLAHMTEDKWREVFLLTTSLFAKGDRFFDIFLKRLATIIADLAPIQKMLRWANAKATQATQIMQPTYKIAALRAWNLDKVLVRVIENDYAIDLGYYDTLALYIDIDYSLALDLGLNRIPKLVSDSLHAGFMGHLPRNLLDLYRRDDLFSFNIVRVFERVIELSLKLQLEDLAQELRSIIDSSNNAGGLDLEVLERKTGTANFHSRDLSGLAYLIVTGWGEQYNIFIESVNWDEAEWESYANYLKGTALLLACLKMATVTDREGIEARLLLPAAQEKGS